MVCVPVSITATRQPAPVAPAAQAAGVFVSGTLADSVGASRPSISMLRTPGMVESASSDAFDTRAVKNGSTSSCVPTTAPAVRARVITSSATRAMASR